MLALDEIIDFLLKLMRDETARAEFEQDPQGTLARAGLQGVTGQDIGDARLLLADSGAVRAGEAGPGHAASYDDPDPVRQIHHTTQHYAAEPADAHPAPAGDTAPTLLQDVDDRDSFFFQNITQSIDNSSTDVAVTSIDATNSFNEGSFTSDDDVVTAIQAQDSFNTDEDNDVVAIQANKTLTQDNDVVRIDALPAADQPVDDPPPADPPRADPAADDPPADDLPADDPPLDDPPPEDQPLDQALDQPLDEPLDEPLDPDPADTAELPG